MQHVNVYTCCIIPTLNVTLVPIEGEIFLTIWGVLNKGLSYVIGQSEF